MAAVIHSLWEKGDRNPLILPSTIPIDDARVQSELTRYLSDNWAPIIEKDVDGASSLPLKIDAEQPNLGKLHATRRVARTIYLGSAPTTAAAHRGLEDRRVKLGCVMPGESPAVFGDALRRLAAAATYLYQDGPRFWYATQPTVTKLAEDRAEQLKRDPDKVAQELDERLRADLRKPGTSRGSIRCRARAPTCPTISMRGWSCFPPSIRTARRPAARPRRRHRRSSSRAATRRASTATRWCSSRPTRCGCRTWTRRCAGSWRGSRSWRRRYAQPRPASGAAGRDAEAGRGRRGDGPAARDISVAAGAGADNPQAPITWQAIRLSGGDALAVRASKKLRSDESLVTSLGSTILRKHLDDVPLWRGDHVAVRQLVDDFARYLYLPRLAGPEVLVQAIRDGVALLTWQSDTFAYAESYDEDAGRYRGLRGGQVVSLTAESAGLLVKPDVARRHWRPRCRQPPARTRSSRVPVRRLRPLPPPERKPRRFHGTASLDPARVGRDASRIADEVIAHLAGLVGAEVTVTLEIAAKIPSGAPDTAGATYRHREQPDLKFTNHGFEEE